MPHKKPQRKLPAREQALQNRITSIVRQADRALAAHDAEQAFELLEQADQLDPGNPTVLEGYLRYAQAINDINFYILIAEELIPLQPHNAEIVRDLALAYTEINDYPLAHELFSALLKRHPDRKDAAELRHRVQELEAAILPTMAAFGIAGDEAIPIARRYNRLQRLLMRGALDEVQAQARELIAEQPTFLLARLSLADSLMAQGTYHEALEVIHNGMQQFPDHLELRYKQIIALVRSGRIDEAHSLAASLSAQSLTHIPQLGGLAEVFTYLGNDEQVLTIVEKIERQVKKVGPTMATAQYLHYGAVAAFNLGRIRKARNLWKRALELEPGLQLAHENLENSEAPENERIPAWPFNIEGWLPLSVIQEVTHITEHEHYQQASQQLQALLDRHPYVSVLMPTLFERGGPLITPFMLKLAAAAGTPELLELLREFAFGQRGGTLARIMALHEVQVAGIVPRGRATIWDGTAWREIVSLGMQITYDAIRPLKGRVLELTNTAMAQIEARNYTKAEALLRQALELAPDEPTLLNNLALTISKQGREAESRQLIKDILAKHPTYPVGIINEAQQLISEEELDQAEALLEGLLQQHATLYVGDAAGLCYTEVRLHQARLQYDLAEQWLALWQYLDPEDPTLQQMQRLLETQRFFAHR